MFFLPGMLLPHLSLENKQTRKNTNTYSSFRSQPYVTFLTLQTKLGITLPQFYFSYCPALFPSVTTSIPVPKYNVVCVLPWVMSKGIHPVRTAILWSWLTALSPGLSTVPSAWRHSLCICWSNKGMKNQNDQRYVLQEKHASFYRIYYRYFPVTHDAFLGLWYLI